MDKGEVVEIIKTISTYYGGKFKMDDPPTVIAAWHDILKDYEFEDIKANLQNYVKNNRFAPSVADIINVTPAAERAIPTHDETQKMFEKWENEKQQTSAADAEKALAELRQILKINRG